MALNMPAPLPTSPRGRLQESLLSHHDQKADLGERLQFIGLGESERRHLAQAQPVVRETIGPSLDAFYRKVKAHPHTAAFFSNDAHIAHAKERQAGHWNTIASGKF